MPRYRMTIEYDGSPFTGWQGQPGMSTIQGSLQTAYLGFTGEDVYVRGAGRTDTGVHALGQVAHVDLRLPRPPLKIREAMNFYLRPHPISVVHCEEVSLEFDARFSATSRHYLYRILNRRAPPALDINRVWSVTLPLDAEAMHVAAQRLLGRHDFTTFRASACQARNPVRTLDQLDVRSVGSEIHIEASARSFLHSQVRSMVGSLKRVGEGKWTTDDLTRAFASCDRAACGPVAPACGLYLEHVAYRVGVPVPPEVIEELATDE